VAQHLLHFFFDGRGDGRVADVGIDFDQEVTADDHRLRLGVVDVRGDYRPAPGYLLPYVFRVYALPDANELHLVGDDTLAGVVHLGDGLAVLGS
jgi:hypothetical protein